MLVVDASVLVAATVDTGENGRWAEETLATGELAAPEILLAEATNILRRLERIGRLESADATHAQRSLLRLPLETFGFEPFSERIWELRDNVTAYDAWYIALAEALRAPMATLDGRLIRAVGPRCEFVYPPEH